MRTNWIFRAVGRPQSFWLAFLLASAGSTDLAAAEPGEGPIPIVLASPAMPAEEIAARTLAQQLGQLYPREKFPRAEALPETGRCILLGTAASAPRARACLAVAALTNAEAYVITTLAEGPRRLGLVAGADARGLAYGIYELLEKLGCGFYLSGDALPPPRTEPFAFAGWSLTNSPLVGDRLVFDWHNFLSGCSTWNLAEWTQWIEQSYKAGFNGIMVHAYGNNPMVTYDFNGQTKPVGYLSTTARGRDWSTTHVNDVRRLWGGQVFNQPVFGAEAAQVPEEQRAEAAQQLMRAAFAAAEQRAMNVYFADDVDTVSANPQELIQTLPPAARFATSGGKFWLADPDTPEGYRYYQTQVQALLAAYPQITHLVVWFRTGGTPWMDFTPAEMPPRWQAEFQAEVARIPDTAKLWHAHNLLGIGKIIRACQRALQETSHGRVQVAAGTWDFKFLLPADRFFPPGVKLVGLDYNVLHGHPQLGDAPSREALRVVGEHRPVLPVIWAHHDDGNYLGRPYTPFADFASKLADAHACGFGIIHWTTRPLDLFFASHARQVWRDSKDEPLNATCRDMAAKSFGEPARDTLGKYLERWVTDAPKFARETGNLFIDQPMTNAEQVVAGCQQRLKLLATVDQTSLTREQRDHVAYFQGLEEFIAAIHQANSALQRSQALLKSGDRAGARAALAECHPEPVIEQFARFSSLGGITRGEQGLVVSMNLRWLPHYLRQRQSLGLDALRFNFAPTSHDKLAQAAGKYTWHFDADHEMWQTLGAEETGASTFVLPPDTKVTLSADFPKVDEEICRAGIESAQPIQIALSPVMGGSALPQVDYRVRLLFVEPSATAAGQRVFDLSLGEGLASPVRERLDVFQLAGGRQRVIERSYTMKIPRSGKLVLTLTPVTGKALISGAVVQPRNAEASTAPEQAKAETTRIKAFCVDFNWGDKGFAPPGLYAGASAREHVEWYRKLGVNTIQTFCVSCPGYAWYRSDVAPVQPGMKGDFLKEITELGHAADMRVMGYFCIGGNTYWSEQHPNEVHPIPNAIAIPLTREYLDYLRRVIAEAVSKTGIDGFMIDWVFSPMNQYPDKKYTWLDCEKAMYSELFGEPFPGAAMDKERTDEFNRRAVDRCWRTIRDAAKGVKPDCIIWLSCYDLQHPQMKGCSMLQEADWVMNEHFDPAKLESARKAVGLNTKLIQCICGWGDQHNAEKILHDEQFAQFGVYGFAKPDPKTTLPPEDGSGNARNIAAMRAFFNAVK